MPRTIWRLRETDSPRPAGRRWAGRLRRSGSLARRMLMVARIRRRADRAANPAVTLLTPGDPQVPRRRGVGLPRRLTSIHFGGRSGQRAGRATLDPALDPALDAALDADRALHADPIAPLGASSLGGVLPVPVSPPVSAVPGAAPTGPLTISLLPGERTVARRLRFALVTACTIGSLTLGMSAVFLALSPAEVHWAAVCLMGCVVFDGLDGALARRLGVASPFGAQMDSMADMCSFGVAAPVVAHAWLVGSAPAALVVPACILVAVCAAIRLARFNVSPKDGRFFCGVPTTMAAAVLALSTMLAPAMPAWLRVSGVAVLALAMVSSFPYAKFARLLRLPPWLLVLPVVGALLDYRLTFVAAVLAYLLSGPFVWLLHRQRETTAARAGVA